MKPYEQLARMYDAHWGSFSEGYVPFLEMLREKHGLRMMSALDLGCGTASLIVKLAEETKRLVGLDASPEMLEVARKKCQGLGNVEFVLGDFRAFELDERFDLVLCCFDSLNYIEKPEELAQVFRCVQKHLTSRGFFVFDVVNEKHCLRDDGQAGHYELEGIPYTMSCRYDCRRRVRETVFTFAWGEERHRQIPIEQEDVVDAAEEAGLSVVDVFADLEGKPVDCQTVRHFFVLRKTEPDRRAG